MNAQRICQTIFFSEDLFLVTLAEDQHKLETHQEYLESEIGLQL